MSQSDLNFNCRRNFLFVSYSHIDKKKVVDFLSLLDQLGVCYWYDIDLKVGERWNERVQTNVKNSSCIGSICFVSKNWAVSDACQFELDFIKQNHDNIYFVSLDDTLASETKKIMKENFEFDDAVIYVKPTMEGAQQLANTFIKEDLNVVDNFAVESKRLILNKIAFKEDDFVYVTIGKYPKNKMESTYRNYSDEVFKDEYDINSYLQVENTNHAYEFEKVVWRLISVDKNGKILINRYSLISCLGRLEDIRREIAKFKNRANLEEYSIDILKESEFKHFKEDIILKPIEESKFISEQPHHMSNLLFIQKDNGEIGIVNQKYEDLSGGVLSPQKCTGTPILIMRIKNDKEKQL